MAPVPLALAVYSAQILGVIGAAALAARFCRLASPAVRLACWRTTAAICLLLPLLSSRSAAPLRASVTFGDAVAGMAVEAAPPLLPAAGTIVVWIWACGVALRLTWLWLGGFRLRQMRRRSVPAVPDARVDTLRGSIAPRAELRWTGELTQPVTFGLRAPVVLLPRELQMLGGEAQSAVVCHELLHVARRDWAWIVAEEHLRALLWFHPALWWLLEQVHLAREQIVDRLVVRHTGSRKAYMSALVAFADAGRVAQPSLPFLRRRQLAARLTALAQEPHMSTTRIAWTTAIMAFAITGAAAAVSAALPLDLPKFGAQAAQARLEIRLAETEAASGLLEVVGSGGRRVYLHPAPVATADDVASARAIPGTGPSFSVAVTFTDAAAARLASATQPHIGRPVAILVDGEVLATPTIRSAIGESAVISGDFTEAEANTLAARLDPSAASGSPPQTQQTGAGRAAPVPANARQAAAGRQRDIRNPVPVTRVSPEYTPEALAAKIEGDARLTAVVRSDGSVGEVTVTQSLDPGLDEQAVKAARQWTFRPGTVDGVPVTVEVELLFTFTLPD